MTIRNLHHKYNVTYEIEYCHECISSLTYDADIVF